MQAARRRLRFGIVATALLALSAAGPSAAQPPPGAGPPRPAAQGGARANALRYTVRPGDNLDRICDLLRERAGYYANDDMLAAIRRANRLQTNHVRPGTELVVPLAAADAAPRVVRTVASGAPVRGIYLAAPACGAGSVLERVDRFIAAGGNTVVFDAKDVDGAVSYRSAAALAGWGPGRAAPVIPSLPVMLDRFHARGLHVVARVAVFLDGELGEKRPDLAVLGPGGSRARALGAAWLDPSSPAVQAYNLELAVELAHAGVDEVQLDYVRYPAGLRFGCAAGERSRDPGACAAHRAGVIGAFVAQVRDSLRARGVAMSVVLDGALGWEAGAPVRADGQDPAVLAAAADILCPTVFPSLLAPVLAGRPWPVDQPGLVSAEAVRRLRARAGEQAHIRPWLQAFPWLAQACDGRFVAAQVRGAEVAGAAGWCLWNPASQYQACLPEVAMPATALAAAVASGSR